MRKKPLKACLSSSLRFRLSHISARKTKNSNCRRLLQLNGSDYVTQFTANNFNSSCHLSLLCCCCCSCCCCCYGLWQLVFTAMVSPPDCYFSELSPRKQHPSPRVWESDSVLFTDDDYAIMQSCNLEQKKCTLSLFPQCMVGQDLNHNTL